MDVMVTCERRLNKTPDGVVWTTSSVPYDFWKRYLSVFDRVYILCRTESVANSLTTWKPVTGERVSVVDLPCYVGPMQFLSSYFSIHRICSAESIPGRAYVLRTPGNISFALEPHLRSRGLPYGVEVVGDPFDAFSSGTIDHPLRPFYQRYFTKRLQKQCRMACAASYVTERALQTRYPPSDQAFTTHYSSASLSDASFASSPRQSDSFHSPLAVVSVGSMDLGYKGFDVLIDAIEDIHNTGIDITLKLIGSGRCIPDLQRRSRSIGHLVTFSGELPGPNAVRAAIADQDLFILPSKTEGLPRVVLEAMAQALPCVSTDVGGTRELLDPEYLVQPGDKEGLFRKIIELCHDRARLCSMSERNLKRAKDYHEDKLMKRRVNCYLAIKERTSQERSGIQ